MITYQTISLEIIGTIDTPNPNISKSVVYIPLDVADQDLQWKEALLK